MDLLKMDAGVVQSSPGSRKPVSVTDLDDMIRQIHDAFDGNNVDVDHVTEILETYKSCPRDWMKFAKFDRYKYTRNLVDEGNGKFNLMLLCWGPSQISSIHDHADAHCFVKMLDGELDEVRFAWPDQGETADEDGDCDGMKRIGDGHLEKNAVCYINDSMGLHRVHNNSDTTEAISLHLYCPPFSSCQAFDERTGKCMKCPVTFHSKFGQKVKYNQK